MESRRLKFPCLFAVFLLCAFALRAAEPRLSGVSTLAPTGTGSVALTTGFVIGPGPAKTVVIRALGPALARPGALADPVLTLFDHTHAAIDRNDNWLPLDTTAFARAGLAPFAAQSKDAALVTTLLPGSYTAQIAAADDGLGLAQIEIHELDGDGAKLINTSTQLTVSPGTPSVVGFSVAAGAGTRRFLLRASGPALAAFGLADTLADPALRLTTAGGTATLVANDDWGASATASGGDTDALRQAFIRAGAFAFPPGSADAALLVDLAPGNYSLHVSCAGPSAGLGLVEIYDLAAAPAVSKILASPPAPPVAALVSPTPHHSADVDRDFRINLVELTRVIELYNTRNGSVRTGIYRISVGSEDGFAPDSLAAASAAVVLPTYHSADTNRDGRISLVELTRVIELFNYRVGSVRTGGFHFQPDTEDGFAPDSQTLVVVEATDANADETGGNPGEFTLTRYGNPAAALTVSFSVGGSAVSNVDYPALAATAVIPAGAFTTKLVVAPNPDLIVDDQDTVVLTLSAQPGYTVGTPGTATVTIADSPSTLYVATLRPENTATDSIASGSATLLLSASGTLASINVSFSNLSSDQVSGHLRISPSGDFVGNLMRGQVTGSTWTFRATGAYTSADLLAALKAGKIYVGLDSTKYPSGELNGTFLPGTGSQAFTPPPAPPAVSLVAATEAQAARFLMQATFGPTRAEITALTGQSIDTWLTAQLALPFTSHRAALLDDHATFGGSSSTTNWNARHAPNRQAAWFKLALTAPDQLRQRVAFALSQILVVSDVALGNDNQAEPLAHYYDLLGQGAFGNFRTLLENVTLSPMMGLYLSSLRNAKANPATGTTPDENFAREVMQLFTIGLNQLQPDGTLKLGANALPVPTYDQTTITEMAKVFTGWAYPSANLTQFRSAPTNYFSPMQLFPSSHDDTVKTIVNGIVIPAAQGGTVDLQLTLDALFNHPNTGPFICRQLIQRLVTSNPSPAYVYRVAQKFADNGSGTRGDLAAVVRAILTDYEARSATVAATVSYGKLKEPLLRLTGLLRSFGASSLIGRYVGFRITVDGAEITGTTPQPAAGAVISTNSSGTNLSNPQSLLSQAALRSPTVFNFFGPNYVEPGLLAAAGLVAPEFQITDGTTGIYVPNYLRTFVFATGSTTSMTNRATLALDLSYEQTLLATPAALVDHVALLLAGGALPVAARDRIVAALAALPTSTTALDRARSAVLLVATTPAAANQK